MHRRPEEHDGKEKPSEPVEVARHGRPTHQRREGPRGAPDDNVLPGAALQKERIDKDVEQQPGEGQQCGQHVGNGRDHPEGDDRERQGEQEGVAGRYVVRDRRSAGGAFHRHVEIAFHDHVDRVGGARHHVAAQGHTNRHEERRPPLVRHHHRRHGREQQKRDDARLGEGHVGPNLRGESLARREAREGILGAGRVLRIGQSVGTHLDEAHPGDQGQQEVTHLHPGRGAH